MHTSLSRRLILTVIVLLALALRLYHLDHQSLWRDEVDTLRFATRPLSDLALRLVEPGENGPLYFVALRPWLAVAGPADFALRFPSAMSGTLAIPAIYILAKRLAGAHVALLAALLAATAPYLVWYGQEAKMYAALTLLGPLSLWWTTQAARRGGLWRWVVLYAITSLALYTHVLATLVVPVQALWLALWPAQRASWPTQRAGWRRWAPVGLYLTALILPYLPLARWQVPYWTAAAGSDRAMASLSGLLSVLGASFGRGVLPVRSAWQLLPAFLAFLSGVLLWSDAGITMPATQPSGRRVVIMLLIWLALPVLLILPISLGLPVLAERYLIWIAPAFLILVGLGLVSVGRVWRPLGAALFAAILALNLAAVASQSVLVMKSDFRSAARFVRAHLQAGDILLYQIPYSRYSFTYYDAARSAAATPGCMPVAELWFGQDCGRGSYEPLPHVDGPYTNDGAAEDAVASRMAQSLEGAAGIWLISSEEPLWDARGLTRAWLDDHGRRTDHADFTRVSVTRYNLAP
jgi:uncharacterized membrane protein